MWMAPPRSARCSIRWSHRWASFTGDGAYEQDQVYRTLAGRQLKAAVVVLPRATILMSKPPSAESNEPKPGRTLIDLARHYVMDGGYLGCRACNRPQQVMYCHSAFPHRVGCANEEGGAGPSVAHLG
jgi:hypothetical protein